jgi:aspartate carbamoyltransferase regulatory subunit
MEKTDRYRLYARLAIPDPTIENGNVVAHVDKGGIVRIEEFQDMETAKMWVSHLRNKFSEQMRRKYGV